MMQGRPFIFIVDDDPSYREALLGLLRSFGYSAETFSGALEFLRSNRLASCNCLIADVQMSVVNGFELLALLRTLGRWPPVILITALPSAEVRVRAAKSGAVGLLSKPIDPIELLNLIDVAVH